MRPRDPFPFWFRWMLGSALGTGLLGAAMVCAPSLTAGAFSLLVYGTPERIQGFGPDAGSYISLAHAVIGSVLLGWSVLLMRVIVGPFHRRSKEGWDGIALSLAAWFLPDTVYSLVSGFRVNALLNIALLALFALPLVCTYRTCHSGQVPENGTAP